MEQGLYHPSSIILHPFKKVKTMSIEKVKKTALIAEHKSSDKDNGGGVQAQVAILTERIRNLTEHIRINKKDNHSKRGLLLMVNRRKKLLKYLKGTDPEGYEALIKKLGLRK